MNVTAIETGLPASVQLSVFIPAYLEGENLKMLLPEIKAARIASVIPSPFESLNVTNLSSDRPSVSLPTFDFRLMIDNSLCS